jgi:hypothetical protein
VIVYPVKPIPPARAEEFDMDNEREKLILSILAGRQDPEPKPLDLSGSGCPDITLLMDTLLDRASPEETHRVQEHAAGCADCRMRLEAYRAFLTDEEVIEPPYEGSLLEIAADRREFVPKRRRAPEASGEPTKRRDELGEAVPVGYTSLAQSRESWPDLAGGLRLLWLPYLLEYVGLDASHTEAMLSYIEQRIPIGSDQRLSALLPGWLVDFARSVNPTHKDIPAVVIDRSLVERMALRRVLDMPGENETPNQRHFREAARSQAFASVDDLLGYLPPSEEPPREVLEYRLYLYSRSEEMVASGVQSLQVP